MPRYVVEVSFSGEGRIAVEAPSPAEASKKVKALELEIHIPSFVEADCSDLDPYLDISTGDVELEES